MVTRLVVCFDGTWDRPSRSPDPAKRVETNVVRFYDSVMNGVRPDGSVQKKWYETGVGTDWWDSVSGGVFGFGLDDKIRDGYRFLVEHYPQPDPGDHELFIARAQAAAGVRRELRALRSSVTLEGCDSGCSC